MTEMSGERTAVSYALDPTGRRRPRALRVQLRYQTSWAPFVASEDRVRRMVRRAQAMGLHARGQRWNVADAAHFATGYTLFDERWDNDVEE